MSLSILNLLIIMFTNITTSVWEARYVHHIGKFLSLGTGEDDQWRTGFHCREDVGSRVVKGTIRRFYLLWQPEFGYCMEAYGCCFFF